MSVLGVSMGHLKLLDNQYIKFASEKRKYLGMRIQIEGQDTANAIDMQLEDGDEIIVLFTPKELQGAIRRARLKRNAKESASLRGGLRDALD